jgi:selenide,water dikinase
MLSIIVERVFMAIDIERRRAVMTRSRNLGHCICNPRQSCPCPTFLEDNLCPCAGERPLLRSSTVALTRHVRKAGCASKIGQADLLRVLSKLPPVVDQNVLVGAAAGDDAGIYRLDDSRALVQTVDVFTPCVDDPYLFGQIAAANSVSDVYAMGGRPITALSVVGFPIETLDDAILEAMLRGGMDKLAEADCALIGGHSINDEEIKFGFAVTGVIETVKGKVILRDRAQPGDVLVLTKPLGTGVISFAAQLGLIDEDTLAETGRWMAALNRDAAELMVQYGAHACTDITGFGLAGHLVAMARGSGVRAEVDLSKVPVFATAAEGLMQGVYGGGVDRNQAYAMSWVRMDDDADQTAAAILYDPQTSGGLLVALPPEAANHFVTELRARGNEAVSIIGRIVEKPDSQQEGDVQIVNAQLAHLVGHRSPIDATAIAAISNAQTSFDTIACCDHPPDLDSIADNNENQQEDEAAVAALYEEDTMSDVQQDTLALFSKFMKAANAPGHIDARNKKLMAVALSIAHHCHPCLKIHLQAAKQMGIPAEEIDEAAHLAIAFGGCTAMMFYKEVRQEVGL